MEQERETMEGKRPGVLVVDDDLLFATRIESVLTKSGYAPKVIDNEPEAVAWAREHRLALSIVNFNSKNIPAAEVVEKLKALPHPAPALGFVSHTWIPQVRPNAMAAGCDLLVANSALAMRLPQLVAKLAPLDGSAARLAEAAALGADEDE